MKTFIAEYGTRHKQAPLGQYHSLHRKRSLHVGRQHPVFLMSEQMSGGTLIRLHNLSTNHVHAVASCNHPSNK